MPSLLPRYLVRLFLVRAVLALAGLTAIALLFDTLANADRVIGGGSGVLSGLLHYAMLRLPQVASLLVPLAVLLAAMMTLSRLVMSHEIVAMHAAGVPIYRIAGALLLGAAVVAGAHFWLAESVLPEAAGRLRLWAERDYHGLPPTATPRYAPTWFAAGSALVRTSRSSFDGRQLYGVTVVRRNESGQMTDYFTARSAHYRDGTWEFHEVHRPVLGGRDEANIERLRLELPVSPERFSALAGEPNELSFDELWSLRRTPAAAYRPDYFYILWLQRKVAQPLGSLVMVLIATPLGLQLARRNTMMLASFAAIFAGFLFFVTEQLLLTLGQSGGLPSAIAAWTPAVVFSILAIWLVLTLEG